MSEKSENPKLTTREMVQILLRGADRVLEEYEIDGEMDVADGFNVLQGIYDDYQKEKND